MRILTALIVSILLVTPFAGAAEKKPVVTERRIRADLKKIDMGDARMDMPIIQIVPQRVRYLSVPEGILNQELETA